jgi:thiol:disulfide interchange protein DsbG
MPRHFLCAMSVSLVALSTPAFAGPGDASNTGSVVQSGQSEPGKAPAAQPAVPSGARFGNTGQGEPLALAAPVDVGTVPVLKHIAATGAQLLELGEAHGLRSVSARSGDQFMILQIAPDGQAVVGGPQLELPVDKLMMLASGQVKELGETHGLRGLYLRNGQDFQVLYVTPDGRSTIAGVMWDATGKNLTREQVSKIDGAVPTMVVEKEGSKTLEAAAKADALLGVEHSAFGTYGDPAAPRLWMIFDPYCSYSVRAFDQLKLYVAAGRIQLAIVPISILDYETNGQSTPAAEALLSQDPARMAEAWDHHSFRAPASQEAPALLQKNNRIAEEIGLKGTPTLIWRKADGTTGEIDGIPKNWEASIAEVEGAHNVSAR